MKKKEKMIQKNLFFFYFSQTQKILF